jgi:hypothetical protein
MDTIPFERTDGQQPATGKRPAATASPGDTTGAMQTGSDR